VFSRLGVFLLSLGLVAVAACEHSGTEPGQPGYRLEILGDSLRQGVVGATVERARVRLTYASRPIRGVVVYWRTDDASAPASGRSTTGVDGCAIMDWTLGPTPGRYTLTASVGGAGEVSFGATAVAGAFGHLHIAPHVATILDVGDSVALHPLATDGFGNVVELPPLEWRSLQPSIATVGENGVVRGGSGGSAAIVVSSGAVADTATVVVQAQAYSVALTTHSATLRALGATVALQAIVRDRFGNPTPGALAGWSSLDPGVATVDAWGGVTAVHDGQALIRVAAGVNADTARITVDQVAGLIVFQPSAMSLGAGDTLAILPAVFDSLGSPMTGAVLTWSSADTSIARLLGPGLILCRRAGTTTVRASGGTATGSLALTVLPGAVVTAAVVPDTATLHVGQTLTFAIRFLDAYGNLVPDITATWSSSDTAKLTVSAAGTTTAKGAGTALVIGSGAGRSASASVTVIP
jgi:uncharacterized protein YjdB